VNYKKVWSESFGSPYDYVSVMHYPAIHSAYGNQRTMWKVQDGQYVEADFGRSSGDMSEEDKIQLNKMYNCQRWGTNTRPVEESPLETLDKFGKKVIHEVGCLLGGC
jgi:hypothetical protein